MSNLIAWAKRELDMAGYREDDAADDPSKWMRDGVLRLLEVFSAEGHSGSSAPYAVSLFSRLASWKPLSPLTGAENEWNEVGTGVWQNRRASSVFRDETGAYWSEGIVFWEWWTDPETGERQKSYFTCYDSRVPISFPWVVPDEPEYREREQAE